VRQWKRIVGSTVVSAGLLVGLVSPAAHAASPPANVSASAEDAALLPHHANGPFDIGVVNEEKVLKALIERGTIRANLSAGEKQKALRQYIVKRAEHADALAESGAHDAKATRTKLQKQAKLKIKPPIKRKKRTNPHGHIQGAKLGNRSVPSVRPEKWKGPVRTDKVLVLLIQFPDFAHNNVRPEDDPVLLYPDYTRAHYQKMIFGKNGYEGPSGQKFISVKQFYEQQSGGSYTIEGAVGGWYTAKHPASYYGGNDPSTGNDANPRELIKEALSEAAKDPSLHLQDFDQEDPYDLDGDGNLREPDGIIDHLMVIHAGVGEEAGGGSLGPDAIWSHSWDLGGAYTIPGTQADVPYWGGRLAGFAYTIEPEDGAAGVFAHEFGHNLGLPDEYDTSYSQNGVGEPVGFWSIMSSGSWSGKIPGTEPSGFSPYDKEYLQSTMPDSNWFKDVTLNLQDLDRRGTTVLLDEASVKGTNADAVRIDLPKKATLIQKPKTGAFAYYGGSGDEIDHKMVATADLTDAAQAALEYDIWFNTEANWDFAMVQVSDDNGKTWKSLATPHTTDAINADGYPAIKANLPGYTGSSGGWIHERVDLSAYAGKRIQIQFRYMTDWGTNLDGVFVDNVKLEKDGHAIIDDGAEGESAFHLDGFVKSDGNKYTDHYYLLEWRNWDAADTALAHIRRGASLLTYDPGLVIWYVDNAYDDNWVGNHPGDGFLGVVDAHQNTAVWSDGTAASTIYQIQDAAFSTKRTDVTFLDYRSLLGLYLYEKGQRPVATFDDRRDYSNPGQIYAGRHVPRYGLKIDVLAEARDRTVGKIRIHR
jgi:immune inhibitor A